jgi:5-(carboxyamino)imidazole ribonucleotide synthase
VLAVELFLVGSSLVINEIAVRPHNSGHFSIEGAETSQFENHLRAVLDLPLGGAGLKAPCVTMVNLLGGPPGVDPAERLAEALATPGVHVHLYGKEARPGRKLGHVTALGDHPIETRERAQRAAAILTWGK